MSNEQQFSEAVGRIIALEASSPRVIAGKFHPDDGGEGYPVIILAAAGEAQCRRFFELLQDEAAANIGASIIVHLTNSDAAETGGEG